MDVDRPVCPCCGGAPVFAFTKTVMGKHEARYATCSACSSLWVVNPHWLAEAYLESDRDVNDDGRVWRSGRIADVILTMNDIGVVNQGRWLDYGSGDGVMGGMLTRHGISVCNYDPYVADCSRIPVGKFSGTSLVEVFEHVVDVQSCVEYLSSACDVLLVSTSLHDGNVDPSWPYLAIEFGQHVTFPSVKGLSICLASVGMTVRERFVLDGVFDVSIASRARYQGVVERSMAHGRATA